VRTEIVAKFPKSSNGGSLLLLVVDEHFFEELRVDPSSRWPQPKPEEMRCIEVTLSPGK
jgi:hypothetical protein